jgi:hypothetical protein
VPVRRQGPFGSRIRRLPGIENREYRNDCGVRLDGSFFERPGGRFPGRACGPPVAPAPVARADHADLLIAADCVPFAYAGFHENLLAGKVLLIGCPKLDDAEHYLEKLTAMFKRNNVRSVTVAHMEVPCCTGLVRLAERAIRESGKDIPFEARTIGIRGTEM